jgi:hypothetical protein
MGCEYEILKYSAAPQGAAAHSLGTTGLVQKT